MFKYEVDAEGSKCVQGLSKSIPLHSRHKAIQAPAKVTSVENRRRVSTDQRGLHLNGLHRLTVSMESKEMVIAWLSNLPSREICIFCR